METTYWLVALPLEGRLSRGAAGAEQVLKVLNDKTSPDLSTNYKARRATAAPRQRPCRERRARARRPRAFRRNARKPHAHATRRCRAQFALPELRVGTLDALLALSDDMVKTMTLVEAVTGKIRRQLAELDKSSSEVRSFAALNADAPLRCAARSRRCRCRCRRARAAAAGVRCGRACEGISRGVRAAAAAAFAAPQALESNPRKRTLHAHYSRRAAASCLNSWWTWRWTACRCGGT